MSSSSRTNGKCVNKSICRKSIHQSVSELKMSVRRRQTATDRQRCVWSQVTSMTAAVRLQLTTSLHDIAAVFVTTASDCLPSTQRLTATDWRDFS